MTEQTRRATRLIEIERKLRQRPAGYSASELARELGYSTRTIQRDLAALESELNVPLMDAPGRRYKILPGSAPLAPVRFTLQEARAVYLASRLFARYADEQDPDGVTALEKLADTLPETIGKQLRQTAQVVHDRPARKGYMEALRRMTDACRHICLGFTEERYPEGIHICYLYNSDEERKRYRGYKFTFNES